MAVKVHAPVLILPISETSRDGFMADLGSVAIQNTILVADQQARVSIDAYGIKLDSIKVSRSGGKISWCSILIEESRLPHSNELGEKLLMRVCTCVRVRARVRVCAVCVCRLFLYLV